ncbi:Abi family protein [Candidatus Tokpelaia sp.]|uniref:Abi family protein n=1 Tax=Candidatus Tokpelaia sp. TaxID=2233777 RepID=UPI001681B6D6|nr:Abi family protein [Candidatus Tokpelaia sp.]
MSANPYPKPAQTVQQHIDLLEQRGMHFRDKTAAASSLSHISYYHLGLYWYDLRQRAKPQIPKNNERLEAFQENVFFEDVIDRYHFDEKLRDLVSTALGKIEISLKTQWAQYFSLKYSPLFYYDCQYYSPPKLKGKKIQDIIQNAQAKFFQSNEDFIMKYKTRRPNSTLPEAWLITEILSFGEFLYFIYFLRQKDKQEFAHLYAKNRKSDFIKQGGFIAALNQLRAIRNICAHNGRLWNRVFSAIPPAPNTSPLLQQALDLSSPKKLYNILCYIVYLLRSIDSRQEWRHDFIGFIQQHPHRTHAMGFPADWRIASLWR